ncbi:hypothetical protein AB6A40_004243 [Gnathostoma spinigerum]|uniref:Myelin regulatory factor n=1 Tax=Gnathostoma spinigerum TaxID=75299 RepID=A0ABD6EBW6_9BILA
MATKRKTSHVKEDSAYSDPLSDCTADFNILQFLEDCDTPVDSPTEVIRLSVQQSGSASVQDSTPGMMFHNPTRLPDSPPITDISGAGSSGSPSSASDSPYSPEVYPNYQLIRNSQQSGSGLILGVHTDIGSQMIIPGDMVHQNPHLGSRLLHHTLPSTQSNFLSTYPSQSTTLPISQVSQPSIHARTVNSGYLLQNTAYQMDPYSCMINAESSDGNMDASTNDEGVSRKRMRPEPRSLPTSIKSESQNLYGLQNQLSVAPSPVTTEDFEDTYHQQAIKFTRFSENEWATLYDINQQPLNQLEMHVVADKGFNYSTMDNCFVNQKKNHFQISVHIEAIDNHPPSYVKVGNDLKRVTDFKLAFCGVKSEMPASEIQIKQSTTDRRPVPHDPVSLEIHERRITKVTVPRLHFSETTMNNQRKNGKPNPDQKYFLLVVRLIACTEDGQDSVVQAYQSEKVIVRASNPGQFEPPDSDATWQKSGSTLFYNNGSVAIGMDRALAPLTVGGDIYCSGVVHRPSDRRVKEEIHEVDTKDAMSRLAQIRVVGYSYKPEIAVQWGLSEENRHRVGVIAQELVEILPDAVTDNGDYLQVDDSRIFYETVAAATELCRLTGNLEHKIEAVEKLSNKLARLHRRKYKDIGSIASGLNDQGLSDRASFMSSRMSLASSAPSCTSRSKCRLKDGDDKCGGRRRCRSHSCSRTDHVLCSSKITQGTIVTLVIVMAVCLIAMSTLYVLDWHNRNFGYLSPLLARTSTSLKQGGDNIGEIIERRPYSWIPPFQPNAPPLVISCEEQRCQTYCCSGSLSGKNDDFSEITAALPYSYYSTPETAEVNKSSASQSSLSNDVTIEILSLNVTLDGRYCANDSCLARRGLFNLYVPVSPYMPTTPLEIRIRSGSVGKYVDSCGSLLDFDQKACTFSQDPFKMQIKKQPSSRMVTDNVFELSVGNYIQSAYRFRIGYGSELCSMSEGQQGRIYDEYNIIFYRRCSSVYSKSA